MATLRHGDVTLAYEERGDGTPVLLLHGFTQRGGAWRPVLEQCNSTHRWITPDLRGHGATSVREGAPFSMEACSEDLVALLEELDVPAVHLAGYSMGGRLALTLAGTRPELLRSLIVISAHAGIEDDAARAARRERDEVLARDIDERGIEWFARHWSGLPMFASLRLRNPHVAGQLHATRLEASPLGLAAALRGMGAGAMRPVWHELAQIRCPALVLAGAEDAVYVAHARRLQAQLGNAELHMVPASGHALHLERPDVAAAIIDEFLDGVDGERGS
ncbi:MAG TPA: 2-succinyl-6-hydroxy-2,4-cyclohexadiene-1-carboxylate synthase [Candidatus Dormibacteraeota bacterium]|nr:2-succinyl-6-hydroxy-2,4-cyclohexadiene-1-carboxylate synthase [Candidatus Dormibacteraeota bacterium]